MKKSNLFILLILLNWIPSLGHSQALIDTSKSYGVHELRIIADTLTKCEQYRKLLSVTSSQLSNREFMILQQDKEIKNISTESQLKEGIISGIKQENTSLKVQLKSADKKLKFTKFGWATSSLFLSVLVGYFAFR